MIFAKLLDLLAALPRFWGVGSATSAVVGRTAARKRTLDAVKLNHANALFERAANRWDFGNFDGAALCATPTAERRQVKSGRTKVVSVISGDKAETQAYREARDIAEQIVQAEQQKENEKVEELADKLIEQQKNLGSEYLALMKSLRDANLTSKDGQEIESMFDTLDESCRD